jgi:hypothetical protein
LFRRSRGLCYLSKTSVLGSNFFGDSSTLNPMSMRQHTMQDRREYGTPLDDAGIKGREMVYYEQLCSSEFCSFCSFCTRFRDSSFGTSHLFSSFSLLAAERPPRYRTFTIQRNWEYRVSATVQTIPGDSGDARNRRRLDHQTC